ncbi:MAG: hypothetical protein ACK5IC_04185 [Moheibacter sp.]
MIKSWIYKTTTLLLATILMTHNINTIIIISNFIINQSYIAKTLCIQKDNQQGCNGKCQLSKQLTKNEKDNTDEIPLQENRRVILDVYFISDINTINPQVEITTTGKNTIFYKPPMLYETTLPIDTPPPNFS